MDNIYMTKTSKHKNPTAMAVGHFLTFKGQQNYTIL